MPSMLPNRWVSAPVGSTTPTRKGKPFWASESRKCSGLMPISTVWPDLALLSPIGIFAVWANTLTATMTLISVAIFFWMFWSISVHSLPGDYFPPRAVGSVYGIAGTGSTVGSVISTWAVGYTLDATHSYAPVFVGIGVLMPVAMLLGFTLMRKVEPASVAGLPAGAD